MSDSELGGTEATDSRSPPEPAREIAPPTQMEVDPPRDAETSADSLPKGLGSEKNTDKSVQLPGNGSTSTPIEQPGNEAVGSGLDPPTTTKQSTCTGNGFNPNLYSAINKLRSSTMLPRQIGSSAEMPDTGSLVSSSNTNRDVGYYRHIYDNKQNISFSFEPRCLMCHSCVNGPHHILGDTYQPACIILSDQNFPAALPASSADAKCPIIFRVEDGTLGDLLTCFRKTIGKVKLPVGSVILICSLSHLARVGMAAYAADLQSTLAAIEEDYGNRVRAAHGLPIVSDDIVDMSVARSLWDTLDWLECVDKRARYFLPDTTEAIRELSLTSEDGGGELATARFHYRLPAGFRSKDTAAFALGGCCRLSGIIAAPDPANLPGLIKTITGELNQTFAVNIDKNPALNAKERLPVSTGKDTFTLLVAGASHGSRLVGALSESHTEIIDMCQRGWKLDDDSALEMAEEVAQHLRDLPGRAALIIQLFDNSIFHGKLPDGSRKDPYKADGVYHVEGEVDTIGLNEMKSLFEAAAPIFRAAKNVPTLVLGPIPRYVSDGCCEDPDHCTNLEDADYAANIAGGVRALGRHLRQLVWHKRWKNVTVINTAESMGICGSYSVEESAVRLTEVMRLWGDSDPVHPSAEAYNNLGKAVLDLARAKCLGNEEDSSADTGAPRGIKRPREERTGRRPDWMAASVTAVARKGAEGRGGQRADPASGAWRPGHGPRGGRGGHGEGHQGHREGRDGGRAAGGRSRQDAAGAGGSGTGYMRGARGGGRYGRRDSW